jgi:hypothetical protein
MGGSSKGGTTTVSQDNEPPKWAEPLFQKSAGHALDLYNSGVGFNIWPGSTVAAPSEMTTLGSQGLANVALNNDSASLAQNPVNLTNQMMSQGGLMAPSHAALGFYGDMAGGEFNPSLDPFTKMMNNVYSTPSQQANAIYRDAGSGNYDTNVGRGYDDVYAGARKPGPAQNNLAATARGDYLAEGNPYFRATLVDEAERLGDQVSGLFASSGRYGSGAHQGVLGDTVGDFMREGLSDDFSRERNLQMQANQMIEAAQQGRLGLQMDALAGNMGADAMNAGLALQGAQGQAGIGQNIFGNRLAGAQAQYGAQQQNLMNQMGGAQAGADLSNQGLLQALGYINAMPTIQQNRTFAPQLLMQSGAVQDQYNQAQVNDMVNRFYMQDMQPWTRLGALQAAATGSAGEYGTMQRMTQQPGQSPLGIFGSLLGAFM